MGHSGTKGVHPGLDDTVVASSISVPHQLSYARHGSTNNMIAKEAMYKSIQPERHICGESIMEQKVSSIENEHVIDDSSKESISSTYQNVFASSETQSDSQKFPGAIEKRVTASKMFCALELDKQSPRLISEENSLVKDVPDVLEENNINLQMPDATQEIAIVNQKMSDLKTETCTRKCLSDTSQILAAPKGTVFVTGKDTCISKSRVKVNHGAEKAVALIEQIADSAETQTIEQIPCLLQEATSTITQKSDATDQIYSITKRAPYINRQMHVSEALTSTCEQVPSITLTGKTVNPGDQVPDETDEKVSSNDSISSMSRKMAVRGEQCSSVREEISTNENVPNMAEVTFSAENYESNMRKETFTNEGISPCVSQKAITANQLVHVVSQEISVVNKKTFDEMKEVLSTEDRISEPSKGAATTVPEIKLYYNDQTANVVKQKASPIEQIVNASKKSGSTDVHMQLENENSYDSDHVESEQNIECRANIGLKEKVVSSFDKNDPGVMMSIQKPCKNRDQTDVSNTCGTSEKEISSIDKMKELQVCLSHRFYGSDYEKKSAQMQRALQFQTCRRNEDDIHEKTLGCFRASNSGINTYQNDNLKQKEVQMPLFSTETQKNLHKLISNVTKQECENAAKEHEMFLKGWKKNIISNVESVKHEKIDFFPETFDVVKSRYSLTDRSVPRGDFSDSRVQKDPSPISVKAKLDIFSSETQERLKRLICATHRQRLRNNELEHQKFIEHYHRLKKPSTDHQTQEFQPFDITEIVRSNYSVVSPSLIQEFNPKEGKLMQQGRAEKKRVGVPHNERMKNNELEYQTFIRHWRMKKISLDRQTQDMQMSGIIEVVRSNYRIVSPLETEGKQKEGYKDPNIVEQEALILSCDLSNSNEVSSVEDNNRTVESNVIVSKLTTSNADQTISIESEDEIFSNNQQSCQITGTELNDNDIENGNSVCTVKSTNMFTKAEPDCADLHKNIASDSTRVQIHSNLSSPAEILEQEHSTDSEPLEHQFTTSTPNVDNNNQVQHISVSPVLKVSTNCRESVLAPERYADLTAIRTWKDELPDGEIHRILHMESRAVETVRLATEGALTFDETSTLYEPEDSLYTLKAKCSDLQTPMINGYKNKDKNLSITGNKRIFADKPTTHKNISESKDEMTVVVEEDSNYEMEEDSYSKNQLTLNAEEFEHVKLDSQSKSDTKHENSAHADPLFIKSIYSLNGMELSNTIVDCPLDSDIQAQSSPELFSQASAAGISACPDVKCATACCINKHANHALVKDLGDSVIIYSSAALEEQLSKCGLTTRVSRNSYFVDPLSSNKAKNSEIKDQIFRRDEQTQSKSDIDVNKYQSGLRVDTGFSIGSLSKEYGQSNENSEKPVNFSSPQLSSTRGIDQTPNKTNSLSPSTAECAGSSHGLNVSHCSSSPTNGLSLSQISDLKDEEEMHLVWSQADVSVGQSSASSGDQENIFLGEFEYFSKSREVKENMGLWNEVLTKTEEKTSTKITVEKSRAKNNFFTHINELHGKTLSGSSSDKGSLEEISSLSLPTEMSFQESLQETSNVVSFMKAGSENISEKNFTYEIPSKKISSTTPEESIVTQGKEKTSKSVYREEQSIDETSGKNTGTEHCLEARWNKGVEANLGEKKNEGDSAEMSDISGHDEEDNSCIRKDKDNNIPSKDGLLNIEDKSDESHVGNGFDKTLKYLCSEGNLAKSEKNILKENSDQTDNSPINIKRCSNETISAGENLEETPYSADVVEINFKQTSDEINVTETQNKLEETCKEALLTAHVFEETPVRADVKNNLETYEKAENVNNIKETDIEQDCNKTKSAGKNLEETSGCSDIVETNFEQISDEVYVTENKLEETCKEADNTEQDRAHVVAYEKVDNLEGARINFELEQTCRKSSIVRDTLEVEETSAGDGVAEKRLELPKKADIGETSTEVDIAENNLELMSDETDKDRADVVENNLEAYEKADDAEYAQINLELEETFSEDGVSEKRLKETCTKVDIAENNLEPTSDETDVSDVNFEVTSDKIDREKVSESERREKINASGEHEESDLNKILSRTDCAETEDNDFVHMTSSTDICNGKISGSYSYTRDNSFSCKHFATKLHQNVNDSCMSSMNNKVQCDISLDISFQKNELYNDSLQKKSLFPKSRISEKIVEDKHFEQQENKSLKRKCVQIPVSLSVKKKRQENQSEITECTESSKNSHTMSTTDLTKHSANLIVIHSTQTPPSCELSFGPKMSVTSPPKSPVNTSNQAQPLRSRESTIYVDKNYYEEKHLNSLPPESLSNENVLSFKNRQITVTCKKKNLFHSQEGQVRGVSCKADNLERQKISIHPNTSPASTLSRHNLKRHSSTDNSLEHTKSRPKKILHFLSLNTYLSNHSNSYKAFSEKPVLPTLSPSLATMSSSRYQISPSSERASKSFHKHKEENLESEHRHSRKESLQQGKLAFYMHIYLFIRLWSLKFRVMSEFFDNYV